MSKKVVANFYIDLGDYELDHVSMEEMEKQAKICATELFQARWLNGSGFNNKIKLNKILLKGICSK